MAVKVILNQQSDFTGEFPAHYAKSGLWRFNESSVDDDNCVSDSSGNNRRMEVINWSGTTANLLSGAMGRYISINTRDPSTEQTHLKVTNDGSIFKNIGGMIVCGGWICPTTYSVSNTYCPIISTRSGPGNPIFYMSLYNGKPRLMLYNYEGNLILDKSVTPPFKLQNAKWYFIAAMIAPANGKACYVVGNKETGEIWVSEELTINGYLPPRSGRKFLEFLVAHAILLPLPRQQKQNEEGKNLEQKRDQRIEPSVEAGKMRRQPDLRLLCIRRRQTDRGRPK